MSQAIIKTLTNAEGSETIYPRTTKEAVYGLGNIIYAHGDEVETEVSSEYLKSTPQELSDAQKAQARSNIGAADSGSVAYKTQLCNPNLLDNWYFGNPVNQRGQTSYVTTWGYTIDRWVVSMSNGNVSLQDGGVLLDNSNSSDILYFTQYIDIPYGLFDKACLSIKTNNGHYSIVGDMNNGAQEAVGGFCNLRFGYTSSSTRSCYFAQIQIFAGSSTTIEAAKLELGSTQTLAHQENGVWVLNEIPDYGEQLARCQRYFINLNPNHDGWFTIGSGYMIDNTTAELVVPIPVTMRAYPSIVTNGFNFGSPSGSGGLTSASIYNMGSSSFNLHCVITKGVAKEPCFAYASAEQYVWLSADL